MRTNTCCVLVALLVVLTVFGNEFMAQAASRVKVAADGSSVATKGSGSVVAQSTQRIIKVKDSSRLADCGPLYQADLVCGGSVSVKGPPCAALETVSKEGRTTTFRFDNGDRVHATKRRDGSVLIDHDR